MNISDFDYELPPELIAREPVRPRDASRMMVVDRRRDSYTDSFFGELPRYLDPSDVLVLNDTRVIRARLHGKLLRAAGTSREVEVLFAGRVEENVWEVLCRPGRRIRKGDRIVFGSGKLEGTFGENRGQGTRLLNVNASQPVEDLLDQYGHIPLPPYINRENNAADNIDYQTVYASASGAIAAPTAGLHFTESMLQALKARGIEAVKITLHVGIGTFIPVRAEDPRKHVLRPERFELSEHNAARLNAAQETGRRIIAVGTTTTRTLEHVMNRYGRFEPCKGEADLFILPGFEFKAVGAMLTNFHLPQSTLLMLVSAFATRETILKAYRHAVENQYRFYSYGDCMLII